MKRHMPFFAIVLTLGLACGAPVRAHFIWLLPSDPGAKTPAVRMIFSEDLQPDKPELFKKISQTELFVRDSDGKTKTVKAQLDKDALKAELPGAGFQEVAGVCTYGVLQRGKAEPFLLHYYAKTFVGLDFRKLPEQFSQSWDRMPLEIVPEKGGPRVHVLWQGKPLASAEAVLIVPGADEKVEAKADREGVIALPAPKKGGPYGIRVLYKEAKEGEANGKKYKEVRHYATLTLQIPAPPGAPARRESAPDTRLVKRDEKPAADAAATKLLSDARAARALYHNFPGFSADIEINLEGQVARGSAEVSDKGKVTLKVENADAEKWAKNTLGSIIGHRLGGGPDEETPCAFVDNDAHHPLGQAIRVLNDEFHSSYRIRDRQVIVVNRSVPGSRFTITVMENIQTKEKKFLPACYVVNTWDAKTNALTSSETHHQTWQRVGDFDLPRETLTVKATAGKLDSRSIKLSNIHLK